MSDREFRMSRRRFLLGLPARATDREVVEALLALYRGRGPLVARAGLFLVGHSGHDPDPELGGHRGQAREPADDLPAWRDVMDPLDEA